jgi:hypothetical protein
VRAANEVIRAEPAPSEESGGCPNVARLPPVGSAEERDVARIEVKALDPPRLEER